MQTVSTTKLPTTARKWLDLAHEDDEATYEQTREKILFSIATSLVEIREELRLTRQDARYQNFGRR